MAILNNKKKAFAVIALLALPFVALAVFWSARSVSEHPEGGLDLSTIHTSNPGCSITAPGGRALDLSTSKVIPKDTLITGECFGPAKH